jgi:hypothetical protein
MNPASPRPAPRVESVEAWAARIVAAAVPLTPAKRDLVRRVCGSAVNRPFDYARLSPEQLAAEWQSAKEQAGVAARTNT